MIAIPIFLLVIACIVQAAPHPQSVKNNRSASPSSYWVSQIQRQGTVAFGSNANYKVFRNVKDYGAQGDGITDDTAAINNAISDGQRCGEGCDSSTTQPAIVYFPAGTYAVSSPIIQYYYTQFIGDALNLPVIQALPTFEGIAVLDSDPYIPGGDGANWYTNQNNFFRQIRNFVIDLTKMPESAGAGIHWQVAQATSLQNIVFNMLPPTANNKQQGIFMDNGSGGFMSDLIFNGGNYGAFLGNQQFTTRNVTFNGCNTAIYMNWNWVWMFKSLTINNCSVGIDMSSVNNGYNQSVGSVLLLDSAMVNTRVGVKTAYNGTGPVATSGTLVMQNVDFTSTTSAVVAADGIQVIQPGGLVLDYWAQGDVFVPTTSGRLDRRQPAIPAALQADTCSNVAMSSTTTMAVSSAPSSTGGSNISTSTSATKVSSTASTTTQAFAASILPSICPLAAVGVKAARIQQELTSQTMPPSLMNGNAVFEKSRPQYEQVPTSAFVSVKSAGAKGDGVTDDSNAIQALFDRVTADQVVYFDHGAYVLTKTINVPKDIRITGEIWPLIMATGSFFSDVSNPQPVFRVGNPGDTGAVEMSDLIFETMGPAPGAIMIEWNVAESSQGSCGMWDVHVRIGGSAGTQLQQDRCIADPSNSTTFNPECAGAFMLMHITQQATAYIENCWFWVADHELDMSPHNQTNIYNGRGVLVESQGPVWLYGTASEHSQLYNYQFADARDVFMGVIQTETAYMQGTPNALEAGFTPNDAYSDPTFSDCTTGHCIKTWGLRVVDSSDLYVFGAGLYSFFDNYSQECLDTESCQENMVSIDCSTDIHLNGLTTKAATNMVTVNGVAEALQKNHPNGFGQTLALFQQY